MSEPSIACPKCGMVSYNPNDVEQRYCGNCHAFHDDLPKRLPPEHPDAPKYWRYETSGMLQPVVRMFINGARLLPADVKIMKAYLWQWVGSPVWAPSGTLEALRLRVAAIETQEDLDGCVWAAVELNMDPL